MDRYEGSTQQDERDEQIDSGSTIGSDQNSGELDTDLDGDEGMTSTTGSSGDTS